MPYLLTKIFFLLLLAAVLGGLFAWWLARRRFQDVTSEHAQMHGHWAQWRHDFEARLAERPQHDLAPLLQRLSDVQAAVGAIKPAVVEPTNLRPLLDAVGAIRIPVPERVDVEPIHAKLAELSAAVAAIPLQTPTPTPTPAPTDLAPLHARLDQLEQAVRAIVIPVPKEAKETDLSGVLARLLDIEHRIGALRMPEFPAPSQPTDLQPLQEQVSGVRRAVEAIRMPAPTVVDLEPVMRRLNELQLRLDRPAPAAVPVATASAMPAPAPVATPAPAPPPAPSRHVRQGSANLLVSSVYGQPDDLKLIKGVAGVLEGMMHKVGVYYFWQVAEWSAADVAYVDTQLTAFKGRIARDEWTKQALVLARLPNSARKPEALDAS